MIRRGNSLVLVLLGGMFLFPPPVLSSEPRELMIHPAPTDPMAVFCLVIFFLSYVLVMTEEKTGLRKSKPVMLGAGLIWVAIGMGAQHYRIDHEQLEQAILHDLDEYGGLLLFLMTAMTYIKVLEGLNVFRTLRSWMVRKGFNYQEMFWLSGTMAFFLSAIADNLTTALVMGTVILAVGVGNPQFIALSFVNIVSAANAGGAFSPFGDIPTLMVWQSGRVEFSEFFALFVPSVITYLVPVVIMSFFVPEASPSKIEEQIPQKRGAFPVIILGLFTIALAVSFEQFLSLPPFMGMMTGLSLLMFFSYYLQCTRKEGEEAFDIFRYIQRIEWDTLLFFFGVMFSVGGLAFIGILEIASQGLYGTLGPSQANIIMGVASAVIDNIPIMFSVLSMHPDMSQFQWLLITLTCGVGGSLLSIGSAAGIALMGTARGQYTFLSHLKWTPVLSLGYAAGIAMHFFING